MTITEPTTAGPSGEELRRITTALQEGVRSLSPVLQGAALIREEAEGADLDDDATTAYEDLVKVQQAVIGVVAITCDEEGAKGLRIIESVGAQQDALNADHAADDEYPDRDVLGVIVPGALAREAEGMIYELSELRMALEPLVARAEAHTAKVEALSAEVVAAMRAIVTDSGAVDTDADEGFHAVIAELTESRRLGDVARRAGELLTEAAI